MNQTPQSNVLQTFLAASAIKRLREERGLTQRALAESLGVTDKAVSKWESGRGLPDISLVEPLAQRLGISVAELLAGDIRANANRAGNMLKGVFYVCPICGNVVHALGEGSFSCCGSTMFPQEAEEPDADHAFSIERVEDDWYVTLDHPMTKDHYISFVAYTTMDGICLKSSIPSNWCSRDFISQGAAECISTATSMDSLFCQRLASKNSLSARCPCANELRWNSS